MYNKVSRVCYDSVIQIMKYLSYLDCSSEGIHPMQCQWSSQSVDDSAMAEQAYGYALTVVGQVSLF